MVAGREELVSPSCMRVHNGRLNILDANNYKSGDGCAVELSQWELQGSIITCKDRMHLPLIAPSFGDVYDHWLEVGQAGAFVGASLQPSYVTLLPHPLESGRRTEIGDPSVSGRPMALAIAGDKLVVSYAGGGWAIRLWSQQCDGTWLCEKLWGDTGAILCMAATSEHIVTVKVWNQGLLTTRLLPVLQATEMMIPAVELSHNVHCLTIVGDVLLVSKHSWVRLAGRGLDIFALKGTVWKWTASVEASGHKILNQALSENGVLYGLNSKGVLKAWKIRHGQ